MIDELFKKLVEIPSISGSETLFQQLVAKELATYSQTKFTDILNNYTVQVGAGTEKVLLTAHADEVGFIVTYINDDGFIYFQPVGGIDADVAVGQIITILTRNGPIYGIIGKKEVWDGESEDSIIPFKELWIDIGANKKAVELVAIGDRVIYATTFHELPDGYFFARGADNKLGVYSLIHAVRNFSKEPNPAVSLFGVTMTQEEIGSRGVQPVINHVQPKYSIVIDTIGATDTPVADITEVGNIKLGSGPVITRGSNTNADLFFIIETIAKREKIPYQVEAWSGPTATDADPIQISGMGSATIVVGIPVRYTHFPGEIFCWNDVAQTIVLINHFLKNLRV